MSSLATCVLETYRQAREVAKDAFYIGVKRAFGVFSSHYADLNFQLMREGYASGYTYAELDEVDAMVVAPAEALARRLEEEAMPPEHL